MERSCTEILEDKIVKIIKRQEKLTVEELKELKEAVDIASEKDDKFKKLSYKIGYMISLHE